jgi:hypothetical protein
VQYYAKSEDENGDVRLTNIIWGMSIKPNLNEDDMEVVIVATGFDANNYVTTIKQPVVGKVVEEQSEEPSAEGATEETPQPETNPVAEPVSTAPTASVPTSRRPPIPPIARPVRSFSEFEECKRTPAYIKHDVALSNAKSVHQVTGIEKEGVEETNSAEMKLF